MSSGIVASVSRPFPSRLPSEFRANRCFSSSFVNVNLPSLASHDSKLKAVGFSISERSRRSKLARSSSGDNESRSVLDAFFLGKAIGEALTERIESTVGELLGTIGRLQSEQQKQVQEFQEEVLERAKRAKEKAARESMASQGLIATETKPLTSGTTSPASPPTTNGVSSSGRSSSPEAADRNPEDS